MPPKRAAALKARNKIGGASRGAVVRRKRRTRRQYAAGANNLGWREFMRAHIGWYRNNGSPGTYMQIWNSRAGLDWDALSSDTKDWYQTVASSGARLTPGHQPPGPGNNEAVPPYEVPQQPAPIVQQPPPLIQQPPPPIQQPPPLIQQPPPAVQQPQPNVAGGRPVEVIDGTDSGDVRQIHVPLDVGQASNPAGGHDADPVTHPSHPLGGLKDSSHSRPEGWPKSDPRWRDWKWNDPGDYHFVSNRAGLKVLEEVPPDNQELPIESENPFELNSAWVKVNNLGKGSFATADIWVKYDRETFNILDRMAVKTVSYADEQKKPKWLSQKLWTDWPAMTVPAEVAALRTLSRPPACSNIIEYRGFRVSSEDHWYRLLTAAAEYGDFHYLARWCFSEDGQRHIDNPAEVRRLPAAFLIDMMIGCMEACQRMVDENVLHNDIKLSDIVLVLEEKNEIAAGANSSNGQVLHGGADTVDNANLWRLRPCLIDFGLCTPQVSNAFQNPLDLRGRGSPGYRPPEQLRRPGAQVLSIIDAVEGDDPVSEKAMVFSMAVSFFYMLHPSARLWYPAFVNWKNIVRNEQKPTDLWTKVGDSYAAFNVILKKHFREREQYVVLEDGIYSPAYEPLRDLLIRCLKFYPSFRPTCAEVLATLRSIRPIGPQVEFALPHRLLGRWVSDFPLESLSSADVTRANIQRALEFIRAEEEMKNKKA